MSPAPTFYRPPVFIIGSPRSGTSILTWCLGQHPNLLGLEESNWMAPFAVDLAVAFRRGSARGERSQLFSMGIERDQFVEEIGECINASILRHRDAFEKRRIRLANPDRPENHPAFKISRDPSDPKSRWVNGTPEYSFGIGGLRKLFPAARFIHLLRHCDAVVPSMLHFDRVSGTRLAETEEEGYQRWMAYVRACVTAENAYGSAIVCRICHEDLLRKPESVMRRILDFIAEPFAPACLEPMAKRINSSNVGSGELKREPPADPVVVAEAHGLWKTLRENPLQQQTLADAAALLEEQFERRVDYMHDLDTQYGEVRLTHQKLQAEFNDRTDWALRLKKEVGEKGDLILELQKEISDRTKWAFALKKDVAQRDSVISQLQKEFAERTQWALDLEAECARKDKLISDLQAQRQGTSGPPSDASSPTRQQIS